jgi:hypothetical protein
MDMETRCLVCDGPLIRSGRGRPRKTCSDRCRLRLSRGSGPRSRETPQLPPVFVEPEPSWESEEEEVPDYTYEPRPATWRKRARRRSGGSSRETAVRNLRELVRTREDAKAQRAAAPAVRLAPVPVAPVMPGPGYQVARRLGESSGHAYPSGRVRSDGGYRAPLVCGHSVSTGAAPLGAGNQVWCPTCQRMVLVGLAMPHAVPPKPARQRRGRRARLPRAPAQELPPWPPMGMWQ